MGAAQTCLILLQEVWYLTQLSLSSLSCRPRDLHQWMGAPHKCGGRAPYFGSTAALCWCTANHSDSFKQQQQQQQRRQQVQEQQ